MTNLVFQAVDDATYLLVARTTFAGQDDAIGGDEGLAGHTGFGILGQEGVDDDIGDAVGHLVGVAFGNAFAGEDIGRAHGVSLTGST